MKPRVLQVLMTDSFSGAESIALSIAEWLGSDFEFAYASPEGAIRDIVSLHGVPFLGLADRSLKSVSVAIERWAPDLIHAHDARASVLCSTVGRTIPVIAHWHSDWPWMRRPMDPRAACLAAISGRLTAILAVSEAVVDEFYWSRLPTIRRRIQVLPNAIDVGLVRSRALQPQQGSSPESDLLFVGRLAEPKDPTMFIRIVKRVRSRFPSVRAVVLGSGPLLSSICTARDNAGLSQNVSILGQVDNPFPYMAHTRVLVCPSRYEGFGLAAAEAAVLGTPVVAARVGGLGSAVLDGVNGYLCASEEEMTARVLSILEDDEEYLRLKTGSCTAVQRFLGPQEYASRLSTIYRQVLKDSSRK
jgi:glycosyltransferase involved in cell wall biosynthesis